MANGAELASWVRRTPSISPSTLLPHPPTPSASTRSTNHRHRRRVTLCPCGGAAPFPAGPHSGRPYFRNAPVSVGLEVAPAQLTLLRLTRGE